jgi:DNA invertase Pin-like site-specific DNA recombinase
MGIVSYIRVSTERQGVSGLGLEAQRQDVARVFGTPEKEFREIESGKVSNRPQLNKAIKFAKENGHTLVVAKLDRLSRSVAFIAQLMDSKVDFKCADMPQLDTFTAHIFAALAQRERESTSRRVKDALAVKSQQLKLEGKRLGCPDITKDGRKLVDIIAENRSKRVYAKPDPEAVKTIKKMKSAGMNMDDISSAAAQIFGRTLSKVTIYSYLKA